MNNTFDNTCEDNNRWKKKTGKVSRMFRLHQRHHIIAAIREDLYSQNFLEIETPLLVKGACPDTHIDSFEVGEGYLATSTEYQIKRMIVGGFEKVFTLTKNFRAHDRGRFHSTEFTMLEWARAFESLNAIEEDTIRFIRKAFCKLYPDQTSLNFNGHTIDFLTKPWERITVRQALQMYLGLHDLEDFSLKPLLRSSKEAGLVLPADICLDTNLMISYLLDMLQPYLGIETPTFLLEWPAYLTSSAPISCKDPFVAERSELYIGGIEIADGFPFLRDAKLQMELFRQELEKRKERQKPLVSIDENYLKALDQGLPDGAGMALGIDRLVMVLTGSNRIADVQAFDWDEL